MSLRRPTVAFTVFTFCYKPFMWCRPDARLRHYYILHFPLEESFRHSFGTCITIPHFSARGVFQTLVWYQYYYSAVSARGVIQALAWHPVFYFGSFLPHVCVMVFGIFSWQTCDHMIFWSMFDIYYTRVLNVCEYIQTYSLACPWLLSWPDCLAWRYASRWRPRNLRCWRVQPREDRSYPGQLFWWEMESHRRRCFQPLPPSTIRNQVLYSQA